MPIKTTVKVTPVQQDSINVGLVILRKRKTSAFAGKILESSNLPSELDDRKEESLLSMIVLVKRYLV